MARPLRIEFEGALYHITSRGNERKDIYRDDADRNKFLEQLLCTTERYGWVCHAYCLMTNHYHLLIETVNPNLSKGMKYLNGTYSQYFNKKYNRVGHVFQGRFTGILVQKENYLLELTRYIVLNPVRARMVHSAEQWPWSSYKALTGICKKHECLTTDMVLLAFANNRREAQDKFKIFVSEGHNQPSPWERLKNQIYLGSDAFVEDVQCKMNIDQPLEAIPKPQRQSPKQSLDKFEHYPTKQEKIGHAYSTGNYTLQELATHHNIGKSTVSRIVNKFKKVKRGKWEL